MNSLKKWTIQEINALTNEEFEMTFAHVVENCPEAAAFLSKRRPLVEIDELKLALRDYFQQLPDSGKIEIIRGHPELGCQANMTDASKSEQRKAGLFNESYQRRQLEVLNKRYQANFGLPFVQCVREVNSDAARLIQECERRLANDLLTEVGTAIEQIVLIAYYRIQDMIKKK